MRKIIWLTVLLLLLSPLAARATVNGDNNSVSFACTGTTGPYSFTFPISDPTAMLVIQNGITLSSATYSIVPVNNNYNNGGSVTLNTACPNDDTLLLQRSTPLTQLSIFADNMPLPFAKFEAALDKLTEAEQDILSNQVVNSLNDLTGAVTLAAGTNVTLTPSGNTVTIASAGAQGPPGPAGPGGAFNTLTGGTNTTAAMVVGTGASLAASGSGSLLATNLSGTPTLPNGTTATTQVVGDSTAKLATDAFVINNRIGTGARGFYATDYGVKADANYSCVAAYVSGNKTVTTDTGQATITNTALTSDVATYTAANVYLPGMLITVVSTTNGGGVFNVTSQPVVSANSTTFTVAITHADVGSAADSGTATGPSVDTPFDAILDASDFYFITNQPCAGSFGAGFSGTVKSQGQFTSINNAHSAQMANNATATCAGSIITGTSCQLVWARHDDTTSLQNWFNAVTENGVCGTGILPAGNMYFTAPITNATSQCGSSVALSANMTVNGFTIKGQGPGQTLLIPSPALDASLAVPATGFRTIIFGTNASQGVQLEDFGIFGGGNSDITNGTGKCILSVGWLSSIQNVLITDWGNQTGGSGAVGACVAASYEGPSYISNYLNYNGGEFCGSFNNYVNIFGAQCFTYEGISVGVGDVTAHGSFWGNGAGGEVIDLLSTNNVWDETNDLITAGATQYCIGSNSAGEIKLNNTHCVGGGSGASGGGIILGGGNLRLNHTTIDTATYGGPAISSFASGSKVFDDCGNNITTSSGASGTSDITYFGSCSVTGTAQVIGNIVASSCGTSTNGSLVAGSSAQRGTFTVTFAGTAGTTCTETVTFPTTLGSGMPWIQAPICHAFDVGGTNTLATSIVNGTTSTTSFAFTISGVTFTNGNTEILQYDCQNP